MFHTDDKGHYHILTENSQRGEGVEYLAFETTLNHGSFSRLDPRRGAIKRLRL
jgi:hypothetical protein